MWGGWGVGGEREGPRARCSDGSAKHLAAKPQRPASFLFVGERTLVLVSLHFALETFFLFFQKYGGAGEGKGYSQPASVGRCAILSKAGNVHASQSSERIL